MRPMDAQHPPLPAQHHHRSPPSRTRRQLLGCCGAVAAGLFTSLGAETAQADQRDASFVRHDIARRALRGLDVSQLWDAHAHLLGTGDSGSGCRVHEHMAQWWHPLEMLRQQVILGAAGVSRSAPSVDRAYVQRLIELADGFPPGAKWLLFAFDQALEADGRERPEWTTFHVPNAYAAAIAKVRPDRFEWVASIHPYRADALAQVDAALAGGARALKWLPSAMNIDLRDPCLAPFYARLAAADLPLIVHCGEEKAVPGAGRDELGNPLLVRAPLAHGVRVIVAHCASLGAALDLDQRRPELRPAFELFARLMDEHDGRARVLGDVSALFQANRSPAVWRAVLANTRWHPRLLHGSDYPLPGVGPLYRLGQLVSAGLLAPEAVAPLQALRRDNPLLFDLALKREVSLGGLRLPDAVFHTRRHFEAKPTQRAQKVPVGDTA